MEAELIWQAQAVEQLSRFFDKEGDARAFVLTGSLAAAEVRADVWSDVDAKIILADHALDRYYSSTGWLDAFGQLIGVERHKNDLTRTLRVCLEGFQRFDLTFIGESALQDSSVWERQSPYVVVWSRLPDLESFIASNSLPVGYQDGPIEELERMVDAFWFKASLAVVKVVRNDLLIGLHLALDLVRDSLVLQMTWRDRVKRTTSHRIGGWGNELVTRFSWKGQENSGEEILNLIQLSCAVFDELAAEILPGYNPRGSLLMPSVESARQICRARI